MTNHNSSPNLIEAQRIITLLAGDSPVTFQTFDEGAGKNPKLARILHGTLEQHSDELTRFNAQGAGIFFMVNQGNQKGRKKENITCIRALFVDLDGAPLEPVIVSGIKPHITVESSSGRFHAYWKIADCPLEKFATIQAALAKKFNGDPTVKDLPRVMRLPGFYHRKSAPYLTSILSEDSAQPYMLADFVNRLGINAAPALAVQPRAAALTNGEEIIDGSRNNTLTSLAGTMRHRGMTEDAMLAALRVENNKRCSPPLDENEVQNIVRSVARYTPDEKASQPAYSRADLTTMITNNDDFDELTGRITQLVASGELREVERDTLYKTICKKTGITLASLKRDAKRFQYTTAIRESIHLTAARGVIDHFGENNLLHADGFLWNWSGNGVWQRPDDREIKKIIHKVTSGTDLTASVVSSVLDLVKTEAHLPNHRFDDATTAINCTNGELVFDSSGWHMISHVREHYRTAMIPVNYDPEALAPRFTQFLGEIFSGDEDAPDKTRIVLEALGYTLIPSCHLEKFVMLIGAGANGKSVLLNVLSALVGKSHVSSVQPSQFENRFQRAHLQGKLANIITEIAEGAEIADAQLKSLVSGEMTTAEHKHKDPFDFYPYAKHWFGTNHLPHTRDFSDALFRRANILTFNNKFVGEKRDVHLIKTLNEELPGILNMALAGLKSLIENNAFTECASGTEIAKKWRTEADQVAQFIEDACDNDINYRSNSADLYNAYKHWADAAGVKRTLNRNNFTNRLERLGYAKGRGTAGTRMIEGLKLRAGKN